MGSDFARPNRVMTTRREDIVSTPKPDRHHRHSSKSHDPKHVEAYALDHTSVLLRLIYRTGGWIWDARIADVWSIESLSCALVTSTPIAAAGSCLSKKTSAIHKKASA